MNGYANEPPVRVFANVAFFISPATQSVGQLAALLSLCDTFIGSDSGPAVLAAAVDTPPITLFGPKDPVQTGPYCSRSIVVRGQADCAPCTRRRCSHVRCMTSITAEQVLAAAMDVLDGKGECRADAGLPPALLTAAGVGSTGVPPGQTE